VKTLVGVDLFLDWNAGLGDELAQALAGSDGDGLALRSISNRGTKVWPDGSPETFCTDHWCCRYVGEAGKLQGPAIAGLLGRVASRGLDCVKTENLYEFDGVRGYSAGGE
jgi:isocitrate dehydrogenase